MGAGPVRQPLNLPSLEAYITTNIPIIKLPITLHQFAFGQSNPTYLLTDSCHPYPQRYVLRKKPPGILLSKTAHKVEREHRIIAALSTATDIPVPKAIALCEDDAVIGTPFYIMSFVEGRIFEDPSMPEVEPHERKALWKSATETLARFHGVDFKKAGLASYGKHSGFYDRQLNTWKQICQAQENARDKDTGKPVGPIPHFPDFLSFFSSPSLQPIDRGTLIHGDYKIDNMIFHPTEPRVIGILDWEMSTIGHPLSDLANFMHPFYTMDMPAVTPSSSSSSAAASNNNNNHNKNSSSAGMGLKETFRPGATPGLPTPQEIMGWYSSVSGWDPEPEMNWAMAFSCFRSSAIAQGIAARVAQRQATSERAAEYADAFKILGEFAWGLVEREVGKKKKKKEGGSMMGAKL